MQSGAVPGMRRGLRLEYIYDKFERYLCGIRSTGYEGPIVAVNYFSPDYNNMDETQAVSALNTAILSVTELLGEELPTHFLLLSLRVVREGFPAPPVWAWLL
jgi:hypothetical protein